MARARLPSLIYANIQGLYPKSNQSKVPFLHDMTNYSNITFISLTETHLKPDIQNSEIHLEGFTPYRSDRIERNSGGSMIYIHDGQPASEIMNISNNYCSGISMYIINYNLIITTIYRPPDCPKQAFTEILDAVKNTTNDINHLKPDILIMGDFNFPRLQWPNGKLISGGTKTEQEQVKSLLQLMDAFFLNQYILEPTRGNNILDLALSNNEQLIHHYLSTPTVLSDHNILDITLNYSQNRVTTNNFEENKAPLSKFNYNNADWDKMNQALNEINWTTALGEECTNKVHNFLTKVEQVCRNILPIKNYKPKTKFIPRERRILMRKRTRTMQRLKLSSTRVNTKNS
jgi:hypothetical protein